MLCSDVGPQVCGATNHNNNRSCRMAAFDTEEGHPDLDAPIAGMHAYGAVLEAIIHRQKTG
jgi:hypothetical protein